MHDNAYALEKETDEQYQVAIGNKGSTFLFNEAETPITLREHMYILHSRCTYLQKVKTKTP